MSKAELAIIVPDAHVPFQNVALHAKICRLIGDIRPDKLIFNGDFLDLHSLSEYSANSLYHLKDVTLTGEYAAGRALLDKYDKACGKRTKKFFTYGNHEDRYIRILMKGDNAKYGDELRSPIEGLRLKERGYEVLTDWREDSVKLGDHLEVGHGFFTCVHTAKKHLDEYQTSYVFGHTHRFQSYVSGRRAAYNIGCTCDIESEGFKYMPKPLRRKWVNGFATVQIDEGGDYYVTPVQVHNDRFYFNGRMY